PRRRGAVPARRDAASREQARRAARGGGGAAGRERRPAAAARAGCPGAPRAGRGAGAPVSAATGPAAAAPAAAAPERADGLRRLVGYVRRNRGRYLFGAALTLAYAALFASVPMRVAWAIRAVELGLPNEEILRRCGVLVAATLGRGVLRFGSRKALFAAAREIEYELRHAL